MKIIFLDFDGVINRQVKSMHEDGEWLFDLWVPECVKWLNHITDATGAKIVVSSSWKHCGDLPKLKGILKDAGVTGECIGSTPTLEGIDPGCGRGHEIAAWIYQHWPVESFVILDDGCDMVHLMPRLVRTESKNGLTEQHSRFAIGQLVARYQPRTGK